MQSVCCLHLALIVMGVVNLVGYFTNPGLTSFNGMLGLILGFSRHLAVCKTGLHRYDHSNRYRCYVGSPWNQRYQNGFLRQRQTVMRSGGVQ